MVFVRLIACVFLLFAFVAMQANAEEATTTDSIATAQAQILNDKTYQKNFITPPAPKPPSEFSQALGRFLQSIAPFLKWVFWIGLACLVIGILWLIVRELLRIGPAAKPKDTPTQPAIMRALQPAEQRARVLLEEADKLARAGKFGEAVHLLLFRSIQDFEQHMPGHVRMSQTSREIELLASMPEHPKSGFEKIRALVERSFFGSSKLDHAAYLDARNAYEDFAFSPAWSKA